MRIFLMWAQLIEYSTSVTSVYRLAFVFHYVVDSLSKIITIFVLKTGYFHTLGPLTYLYTINYCCNNNK